MKLKETFIVHNTSDETLLVPTGGAGFSGMVRGNNTFGAVLELLKTDTTEDEIIAELISEFDAPESMIASDVKTVLGKLRSIGALDE